MTRLRSIFQLKIQLKGLRPPIWRRVLVSNTDSLDKLHHTIQISMGWTNSHLHQFVMGRRRYGVVDPEMGMDWDSELLDEVNFKVKDLLKGVGDTLFYEYDFGDGWVHQVKLEKVSPFETSAELPLCITGKRACPPEDIGGVPGYLEFIEQWQDEAHPEHEEVLEWVGDEFAGPEYFDLAETNDILRGFFASR